jgi:23S rRNA (adenine2503-C2)-methyltransferase
MAGMAEISQVALLGLDRAETTTLIADLGEPAYRAKQLLDAVYRQRVDSIGQILTLSHELRGRLEERDFAGYAPVEERFVSPGPRHSSLPRAEVETVWMPEGDDGEAGDGSEAGDVAERFADKNPSGAVGLTSEETPTAELKRGATQKQKRDQRAKQGQNQGRSTICISSQVGCAVDCQFCLTALLVGNGISQERLWDSVPFEDQKVFLRGPHQPGLHGMGETFKLRQFCAAGCSWKRWVLRSGG